MFRLKNVLYHIPRSKSDYHLQILKELVKYPLRVCGPVTHASQEGPEFSISVFRQKALLCTQSKDNMPNGITPPIAAPSPNYNLHPKHSSWTLPHLLLHPRPSHHHPRPSHPPIHPPHLPYPKHSRL